MGMDINSSSGVVLPLEDAAPRIFGGSDDSDILKTAESVKDGWKHGGIEGLENVRDSASLSSWLCEVAERMTNKEEGYIDSMALADLFEMFAKPLNIDLPPFYFDYWTRSRINGWEVPIDVPCIVFYEEGLFETKMTKDGKRLAKSLGLKKIELSTWTTMSV